MESTSRNYVLRSKRRFKSAAPGLYALCSAMRRDTLQLLHDHLFVAHRSRFREIYRTRFWAPEGESVSGPGSSLAQTAIIRTAIPQVISRYNIASLLDIPCGDFWWARHLEIGSCVYTGADIVEELVENNSRTYGSPLRQFSLLDLTCDRLPRVDMILCRDCLVHLSFKAIGKALLNMKASGAKYLLTTTYPDRTENINVVTGGFRPLNFQIAPFNFSQPICMINEG